MSVENMVRIHPLVQLHPANARVLAAPADAPSTEGATGPDVAVEEPGPRKRPKRLTRAEKGAWRDNTMVNDEIFETAPIWPENIPLYDPQHQAPFLYDNHSPLVEAYKELRRDHPLEFHRLINTPATEDEAPWPGANKILDFEVNVVFEANPRTGEPHPLNKKAKCRVYLRDLQREFDLSDRAIKHIAQICGPRYNPNKGLLTLTSEKFREREDNRKNIVVILTDLVAEGRRAYPSETQTSAQA